MDKDIAKFIGTGFISQVLSKLDDHSKKVLVNAIHIMSKIENDKIVDSFFIHRHTLFEYFLTSDEGFLKLKSVLSKESGYNSIDICMYLIGLSLGIEFYLKAGAKIVD